MNNTSRKEHLGYNLSDIEPMPLPQSANSSFVKIMISGNCNARSSPAALLKRSFSNTGLTASRTMLVHEDQKLSNIATVYTIVNLFVGLGLLSKPFAMARGGLISIVGLACICFLACFSGKLIVKTYARLFQLYPMRSFSFPDIGDRILGKTGRLLVNTFVILEYVGATIVCIIFLWRNVLFFLESAFGLDSDSMLMICIVCILLLVPTVWCLNFYELWFLSLIGITSTILITITLSGLAIYVGASSDSCTSGLGFWCQTDDAFVKALMPDNGVIDLGEALGIFILSLAGHAALPAVYTEMENPQDFPKVMNVAFVLMFIMYTILAVAGFVVYGRDVDILVSNDIVVWPGGTISCILTALIVFSVFASISPIMTVLSEIPENIIGWSHEIAWHRRSVRVFRTVLLVVISVVSYILIDDLDLVEAITGSFCTMMTSFILPLLFAIVLFKDFSKLKRFLMWLFLFFSVAATILLTTSDFVKIYE